MTCVVGYEKNGKVWIGADSNAGDSSHSSETGLSKVFRVGPFLIGYSGCFRYGQLIANKLRVKRQMGKDDARYMETEFSDAVKKVLKANGACKIENGLESSGDGCAIIGYRGHLYSLWQDFHVNISADGIEAIGSGMFVAIGAATALSRFSRLAPEHIVKASLQVAGEKTPFVRGPYTVMSL